MVVKGKIEWISGPAVRASNMAQAKMYEVVQVGEEKLIGEIIKLTGDIAFIQVYESTSGLRPGEPVIGTGQPLSVTLGPGCIGTIYDGLQRPLDVIAKKAGPFITRGVSADSISFEKKWEFEPTVNKGDEIEGGSVIGKVQETPLIEHKVLAPPNLPKSKIRDVSRGGKYTVDEVVVESEDKSGKRYELKLYHKWPVRVPRPIRERLDPEVPLITGQRVLDSFFPMAKGGTGAIPGGFGTGKCVPPDTPVLLSNGELIPIEALYNKFARANKHNDEDLVPVRGLYVISFDGKSLIYAEVSHVYKGKTDRLIRVRTRSGRSIEVTPNHKLITFSQGVFEERAASELKQGDLIAMPRKIPVKGSYQIISFDNQKKDETIRMPNVLDQSLAEFLGLLIPRGTLNDDSVIFLTDSMYLQRRFSDLARRIFGLSEDTCISMDDKVLLNVSSVASLIRRLCDLASNDVRCNRIPSIIMRSPIDVISTFIKGYFLSNGSFNDGVILLGSSSKPIIEGLSYLLGRLGILFSVNLEDNHYEIGISGYELKNFVNSIDIRGDDIVCFPKVSSLVHYISRYLDSLNVNEQDKLIKVVNGGLQLQLVDYRFATRYDDIEKALEWVFLDEIESIEVVVGKRSVYDITVPKFHNFIGGYQPTLLHNTVTLHSIAKWADSKVVLHIGCGERGNEMTEVLVEFPELLDPRTGRPLMERTILVANVSNMPVAAREASIYTGVTMAEYYRDMGYDVVLVADSTSRWAEALREISGRLEEMPAEEGYPSYLASRLAEFYERAGRVRALGTPDRIGSVTLIGAVSPAGADFTEPVTSQTIRFVRTFWALDTRLAYSRHYPAINWMTSYSGYIEFVSRWWASKIDKDWLSIRNQAYGILQREDALKEIVRLLGPEALPDEEKLILDVARMIQIGFLQQNAYDEVDAYCSPEKQFKMMKMFVQFYDEALKALRGGIPLAKIRSMQVISKLLRSKFAIKNEELDKFDELVKEMLNEFKMISGVQEVKLVE